MEPVDRLQATLIPFSDRRRIARAHIEGLASWLVTRADLLALAELDDGLSADALAGLIGQEAFHENPKRFGASTWAEFRRQAAALLDASRDPAEVLRLTVRQRAAIIDALGSLEMRRSARSA